MLSAVMPIVVAPLRQSHHILVFERSLNLQRSLMRGFKGQAPTLLGYKQVNITLPLVMNYFTSMDALNHCLPCCPLHRNFRVQWKAFPRDRQTCHQRNRQILGVGVSQLEVCLGLPICIC